MTWNEYAAQNNQCFVDYRKSVIQATRHQPERTVIQWLLFLPEPHGSVYCKSLSEARECAKRYGCTVIL